MRSVLVAALALFTSCGRDIVLDDKSCAALQTAEGKRLCMINEELFACPQGAKTRKACVSLASR